MVIYVLKARLECLTNFTIFRFRWFNNWFPYFWINWLGYGLTLGYLLFISIFFWIFPFCSFRPQKVREKRRKARKTRPHWANGQENLKISTHQAGEFRFTPAPPIHFRSCRTFHTLSRHFRSLSPRSLSERRRLSCPAVWHLQCQPPIGIPIRRVWREHRGGRRGN